MTTNAKIMADFARVAQQAQTSLDAARAAVINETAERVVRQTPVDTGFLRASWTFGEPGTRAFARSSTLPPPGDLSVSVQDVQGRAVIYFVNRALYAKYVEGNQGFVSRVLSQVNQIENAAATRLQAGSF